MTRYYIAHEDASVPAVYQIDEDWLAHTVPDWEAIEDFDGLVTSLEDISEGAW